jgi:hypothetical protein
MSETDNKTATAPAATTTKTRKKPAKREKSNFLLVEEIKNEDGSLTFKTVPLPKGLVIKENENAVTAKILAALKRAAQEGDATWTGKRIRVIITKGEAKVVEPDPTPRFRIGL